MNSQDEHAQTVNSIRAQVKQFYAQKQTVKIYHGSANSTRPFGAGEHAFVDISALNHVLEVNAKQGYIIVEPNVAMDQLVDATLEHGFIPPVVPEFPGITVGGAIQGGAGESSSFRYGLFSETCLEYEVVLGNGNIAMATPAKNTDLFWGISCSYGSLGIITQIKLKIVPASKYVRLRYYRRHSHKDLLATIHQKIADNSVDFVDSILFSNQNGVVMAGSYSDYEYLPKAKFHRATDDWFYVHTQKIIKKHHYYEEIVPLKDYLFRYDRGAFWTAKYIYGALPFNRITRVLGSGLFATRTLFKLFQGSNYAYQFLVQDVCVPAKNAIKLLDFSDKEYDIYPLWLCPLKAARKEDKLAPTALKANTIINVGIWGEMRQAQGTFADRNRQLEARIQKLGGRKVMYAHCYYTQNEFWSVYDQKWYKDLRQKYDAFTVFPDVYSKTVTPPAKHKPSKFRGFLALFNSPYNL